MHNISREQTVDLPCDLHVFGQGTNGVNIDPPRRLDVMNWVVYSV